MCLSMDYKDIPWTDKVYETEEYAVFKDGYPVTDGHVLFVPKTRLEHHLFAAYKAALGYWRKSGILSYNIGQNVGKSAGQTIDWPHIHFIPRKKGDMNDPTGGVRHVIPHKGNYRKENV